MKALIIYESMFGSTQAIASAIGGGLTAQSWTVDVVEVGAAPTTIDSEVDLLVAGGPTHQFGLSRPSSRKMAARDAKAPLVSGRIGVREWLEEVKLDRPGLAIAAFDTLPPGHESSGVSAVPLERSRSGWRDVVAR